MILERNTTAAFANVLSDIKTLLADLCVILIMNSREDARMHEDYVGFSRTASLYDSAEIGDIISTFRSTGIHVEYFEDEMRFINWHQSGGYKDVPRRHKFVYSFAINGTGPARRSFVPAYCSQERIPTVNSDAYTSAVGRHKFHANQLLNSLGVPVPRSWLYDAGKGWFRNDKPLTGAYVIGKATYEDGSIGLTPATVGAFDTKLEAAFADLSIALRQPVTVQDFIIGDEIQVPVIELDHHCAPAPVMMLDSNGKRFERGVVSYDDAWSDHYRFAAPIGLTPKTITDATSTAVDIASALGHHGFARIDFRVGCDGRPLAIDIAAHPHLTRNSAYGWLFQEIGFSYDEMLLILIATAARRIGVI